MKNKSTLFLPRGIKIKNFRLSKIFKLLIIKVLSIHLKFENGELSKIGLFHKDKMLKINAYQNKEYKLNICESH